jgi:amino-acid N-acetyltransferase
MEHIIRRARTRDIRAIAGLVADNVASGRVLRKATVTLYEDVQEFWVAERLSDRQVVGCGALHVMWEDLAEIRTVAVDESSQGHGIGHRLIEALLDSAREVGVARVFVLTFATGFFARHGFEEIEGTPVSHEVYAELLRSYDEGVAEFLDLGRVKPNTLGNSRMLLRLPPLPEAPLPGAAPAGTPLSGTPLPGLTLPEVPPPGVPPLGVPLPGVPPVAGG